MPSVRIFIAISTSESRGLFPCQSKGERRKISNSKRRRNKYERTMFLVGLLLGFYLVGGIRGLGYYIEDAYIQDIDEEYFDAESSNIQVVWVNVTSSGIAMNLTVKKILPKTTTGHFDLYLKTMGEYKTHSGITSSVSWCSVLSDPVLLGSLATALGMSENECPPPPGQYGTGYWEPSTELMPDYFPGLDYKVIYAMKNRKKVLLLIWVFVTLV